MAARPLERLFQQFADGGGELWLCPICVNARGLADEQRAGNVRVAGATPTLEWTGRQRHDLQLLSATSNARRSRCVKSRCAMSMDAHSRSEVRPGTRWCSIARRKAVAMGSVSMAANCCTSRSPAACRTTSSARRALKGSSLPAYGSASGVSSAATPRSLTPSIIGRNRGRRAARTPPRARRPRRPNRRDPEHASWRRAGAPKCH
jgi:hypothetical protein